MKHIETIPPSSRRRQFALQLLALLLTTLPATAAAQENQDRWVYGPGDPVQCGNTAGFPTLHAALEGVNPGRPVTLLVSQSYQHRVPDGPDPRVRISGVHAASGGQVRLLGGMYCSPDGSIVPRAPGATSWITAVNGGRILVVDRASSVLIEGIEFRGTRGPTGTVQPALHIVGSGPDATRVLLRHAVIANNSVGNSGVVIVSDARLDIEGAAFLRNESLTGAALVATGSAQVSISGSPDFVATLFERNASSTSGGAIQLRMDGSSVGPRLSLDGGNGSAPGVRFLGNSAVERGGAIEVGVRADLEIRGQVRFEGNTAAEGGAIAVNIDAANAGATRLRIFPGGGARAHFSGNRASRQGGAIQCRPNDAAARNVAAIGLGPTVFIENESQWRGGALHVDGCRVDSLAGPGLLEFISNRVTGGVADPAVEPEPRGGGAVFVTRANASFGAGGAYRSSFERNRVNRVDGYWGRNCGTQYCVLRGLSGGAAMLFDGAGFFYDARFVENLAPFGGAISALDANLTVDQTTACTEPRGCSQFLRNRANGAAYLQSEASTGRARRGYGAAVAVRNDRADPATGLHRSVRIQRSRFTDHGSGCTTGMSCALDPERLLRGRVIQANVPDAGQLIVRGNLFANNAQPDDLPTSSAQADDAEVSLYRRPASNGELRPVLLAANTFWKDSACPGAPWLVDVRDSTGQAGRIDVAANLLLGCWGDRNFTAQTQTQFGVYACNLASAPAPMQAVIRGHNQLHPANSAFFVDPAGGDFRLRDNAQGAAATDICGTTIAGQSIVSLLQSLESDLAGQPRPVRFGGGLSPEAGDWDVGAYERQPAAAAPIFTNGFE